ncbi:MAG: His-Xaa-Ser system protein HxsD [Candidatus Gastranaerophilales bacterium]|nr:His-Xaa-Ser system protein HxsD [Candidatus Gastranaerophilales bacterium]
MDKIVKTITKDQLLLELNNNIYDINAINQTAYKFTDKCYIYINPLSNDIIGVYFKLKEQNDSNLELLADNFCNELLDQQVRISVNKDFGHIRDILVKKAFQHFES